MPEVTREEMVEALRIEIMLLEARVTTGPQHLAALRAALRVIEAGGWRPITDTEPARHGNYYSRVTVEEGLLYGPDNGPATHWMPLPAPPGTSDGGEG